jgi:multisubunit Na+/H+ antiporter MnhC subunit
LPNGALLPNSAHRSVSSLYQFLVLTPLVIMISITTLCF